MPFWNGVSGEEAKRVAAQNAARGRTDNSGGGGCLVWCAVMAATTTGVAAVAVVAVRQAARS